MKTYVAVLISVVSLLGWDVLADDQRSPYFSSLADSPSGRNMSGIWWAQDYTSRLTPVNGEPIPFTTEGRNKFLSNLEKQKNGKLVDRARHICLPQGTPRIMTTAYPFMVIQTPGFVNVLFEENRMYRTVTLSNKHADPATWDPSFLGNSIGSWEGDTLVVESTNFKTESFLDDSLLPHSDKLVVTERLRKIDDGKHLEDVITISDPKTFTHPWTTRLVFVSRPDVEIMTDWVCGETHRSVAGMSDAPR